MGKSGVAPRYRAALGGGGEWRGVRRGQGRGGEGEGGGHRGGAGPEGRSGVLHGGLSGQEGGWSAGRVPLRALHLRGEGQRRGPLAQDAAVFGARLSGAPTPALVSCGRCAASAAGRTEGREALWGPGERGRGSPRVPGRGGGGPFTPSGVAGVKGGQASVPGLPRQRLRT